MSSKPSSQDADRDELRLDDALGIVHAVWLDLLGRILVRPTRSCPRSLAAARPLTRTRAPCCPLMPPCTPSAIRLDPSFQVKWNVAPTGSGEPLTMSACIGRLLVRHRDAHDPQPASGSRRMRQLLESPGHGDASTDGHRGAPADPYVPTVSGRVLSPASVRTPSAAGPRPWSGDRARTSCGRRASMPLLRERVPWRCAYGVAPDGRASGSPAPESGSRAGGSCRAAADARHGESGAPTTIGAAFPALAHRVVERDLARTGSARSARGRTRGRDLVPRVAVRQRKYTVLDQAGSELTCHMRSP